MKKRIAFMAALMGLAINFNAQVTAPTWTEWHDMEVNNVNRMPVHTTFFAFENEQLALKGDMTKSKRFLSLHGNWKFNWVENADQRPTDFFKTDLDDSAWGTMPVPGIWELNGYGDAEYVTIFDEEANNNNPVTLSTVESDFLGCFVPGQTFRFKLRTTYDVYDKEGNLIRRRCVAENVIDLKEKYNLTSVERGHVYSLTLIVNPTYLYVLSEPDVDDPTITIN